MRHPRFHSQPGLTIARRFKNIVVEPSHGTTAGARRPVALYAQKGISRRQRERSGRRNRYSEREIGVGLMELPEDRVLVEERGGAPVARRVVMIGSIAPGGQPRNAGIAIRGNVELGLQAIA